MPRPTTKAELITAANTGFEKLIKMIADLTPAEQLAEFNYDAAAQGKEAHWQRDKNLRDVLAHLYEWHRLLIVWITANTDGNPQPFLPAPYNWKTYGDMNVEFWKKHQSTSLDEVISLLANSHKASLEFIEQFTDAELFDKKTITWTSGSTLGSYCVSATASHYDWAMKKLKAHKKARQNENK